MLHIVLILTLFGSSQTNNIQLVREYQPIPSGLTLTRPTGLTFDQLGLVYVMDQDTSSIFVWNPDGSFKTSFGKMGEGPGEFQIVARLVAEGPHLFVQDLGARKIKVLNLEGVEQRAIPIFAQIETFFPLTDGSILLSYHDPEGKYRKQAMFELVDQTGQPLAKIGFPNTCILNTEPYRRKGYCGNPEIQKNSKGQLFFGYSERSDIYKVDTGRQFVLDRTFKLPTNIPSPDEVASLTTDEMKLLVKFDDFSYPKAFYSQFLIRKDKIVFISTISGNNFSKGMSFEMADYMICDYTSGVIEGRGHFRLEEGSVVMYQRERIFAIVPDEEGDFRIWDAELDGLDPLPVRP